MSIELVKEYFKAYNIEDKILEFDSSSKTVELAAKTLNTSEGSIAKTMSFADKNDEEGCILIVCAGDVNIDNKKFKTTFGFKCKMLRGEEVEKYTNHKIGGVCPFANPLKTKVYIDNSVKRFENIFPACGSGNSAIKLNNDELFNYSKAIKYVDVCKVKA